MKNLIHLLLLVGLISTPLTLWSQSQTGQSIDQLNGTIQAKTQLRDKLQQQSHLHVTQIRHLRSAILHSEVTIKQLHMQDSRIKSLATHPPSSSDQKERHNIRYKRKVAEISLKKDQIALTQLVESNHMTSARIDRLDTLLLTMHNELNALQAEQKQTIEKNRQAHARLKKVKEEKIKEQKIKAEKKATAVTKKPQAHTLAFSQRQEQQTRLLNNLPNKAKNALAASIFRSQKKMSGTPKWGESTPLKIANPVGSIPQKLADLEHIGNNQYRAIVTVKKGLQHYIFAGFKYKKDIPRFHDGMHYLALIDARSNRPAFTLLLMGPTDKQTVKSL